MRYFLVAIFLGALFIAPDSRAQQDADRRDAPKPKDAKKASSLGERILGDRDLFPEEFARSVREGSAGKGRMVPSPTPEIAKVEKKYGKAQRVEVKIVSITGGPTVMMAVHTYGDIGLGVANGRVMAVLR